MGTMHRCNLCEREITDADEALYCEFCHAVFHRACIMEHFYFSRSCPACHNSVSLLDLHVGEPPVIRPIPKTIRKPRWPPMDEVPLFKTRTAPSVLYRYTPKKMKKRGFSARVKEIKSTVLSERTVRGFKENKKGMLGLYMLAAAVIIAFLAPVLILYDPVIYMAEDAYVYHSPTWKYPLGTDVFGRDVYSQIIWGSRNALMVAVPSALLVGVIGTLVGLTSGYCGGLIDAVLQRISMAFLVWPSVPLVALIVFSWGGYMAHAAVILGVAFTLWPTTARGVRAEVLSLKARAFIESAKVCGASSRRIVFRHILPRIIHISFLYMTIAVASALVLEATFNFLGLTSPAVITWGQMLSFSYHASSARFGVGGLMGWWTVLPPASAIAYLVLSFFLISAGLRESMRLPSISVQL